MKNTFPRKRMIEILVTKEIKMSNKDNCEFYSDGKCMAAELESCDFEGDNSGKCLRYRVYYLRPQTMQLR